MLALESLRDSVATIRYGTFHIQMLSIDIHFKRLQRNLQTESIHFVEGDPRYAITESSITGDRSQSFVIDQSGSFWGAVACTVVPSGFLRDYNGRSFWSGADDRCIDSDPIRRSCQEHSQRKNIPYQCREQMTHSV